MSQMSLFSAHESGPRSRDLGFSSEDSADPDEALELPVEPDDGSVIPDDDDRVVNVPS